MALVASGSLEFAVACICHLCQQMDRRYNLPHDPTENHRARNPWVSDKDIVANRETARSKLPTSPSSSSAFAGCLRTRISSAFCSLQEVALAGSRCGSFYAAAVLLFTSDVSSSDHAAFTPLVSSVDRIGGPAALISNGCEVRSC